LSTHNSAELKLIVLESGYKLSDAKTIRRKIDRLRNKDYYEYNYPMYFEETNKEGLYNKYHKRDDPRSTGFASYEITKIEKLNNCKDILIIEEYGINTDIVTDLGTGRADSIKIDYGTGLITFENIRVKC